MVVVISSKQRFKDKATPTTLGEEVDLVSLPSMDDDYEVEGYIDLSQMQDGDEIIIREYIAVDGTTRRIFTCITLRNVQSEQVLRVPCRLIPFDGTYRITITQTKGTLRTYPYSFVVMIYGTS